MIDAAIPSQRLHNILRHNSTMDYAYCNATHAQPFFLDDELKLIKSRPATKIPLHCLHISQQLSYRLRQPSLHMTVVMFSQRLFLSAR